MFYNHTKPFSKEVTFFNYYLPDRMIEKPKYYVVPAGWYEIMERLSLNNVVSKQLKHDSTIKVTKYKIEDYKSRPTAYEKHHTNYGVKTSSSADSIKFLKGDYLIELNQPNNRYIIEMLEPTGDDSFFAWNFF